ncbi:autotransporter assembly complex protein TamA [Robbsia andropogonis]|uniref:autotransporter assembly complex protein TamA n=1 Tax=Robbsia andropogonis TaxID=28092 RepID=UPI0004673EB0|nr:autotransporter assembly complex family protein [Robbsia andropogonis]MCP1116497.1 autotransporter assembly complex protein TamA [Robbsia andropogonis]MCP1126824.1 autotransporter assembly complex protein TamA [Robbsia andropogonis]
MWPLPVRLAPSGWAACVWRRIRPSGRASDAGARSGVRGVHIRLLALCFAYAPAAWANYDVDIVAPHSLKKLLKQNLNLSRFSKRKDIDAEQLRFLVTAAPQQARELVQTRGYFTPVISTDLRTDDGKSSVTLRVAPGPQTTVSEVNLSFTGAVQTEAPDRALAARVAWPLKPGDPFSQSSWDDAKKASLTVLQAKRYLGARIVHSEAKIDPRTHTAVLNVEYGSGPTFHLGPIKVNGVKRYPEFIVDHVNPLHEGEIYDATRIQTLQRQIQNTPYYASVAVDVAADPAQAAAAPVSVSLNEYQFHSVRAGVGYTTDRGARVEGAYSYNNVFNRAYVFTITGRLEQKSQYGSVQLSMPPDSKGYTNSALASYTRTDTEGTVIYSLRTGFQRTRSLQFYDYSYSLLYYQDRLEQNSGPPTVSRALLPAWAWARRNVDDPMFPRSGNLIGAEAGFAVKGALSDATFLRLYAHGRQYVPLGRRDLLLFRAELGGVFSNAPSYRIPATLLFRTGGATSVRGYGYDSIGNDVAGSVLPTKYLITGGVEYQHWFSHDWGAAVFYDVGTASDTWDERRFYQGVGIGARWRSPVGPLNVDVGYGIQNRSIRPYLTLGVAF